MPNPQPLQPGQYYHIYNRGIDGQPLFREQRNYPYFLELYAKYIEPVAGTYATYLVVYIHRNPQRHGFVNDFRLWPYSSYQAILSTQPTRIQRATVLDWFDGPDGFEEAHDTLVDESPIEPLVRLDQS